MLISVFGDLTLPSVQKQASPDGNRPFLRKKYDSESSYPGDNRKYDSESSYPGDNPINLSKSGNN